MMGGNHITIDDGELVVEPRGLDTLWSFRRHIRIPLTQVEHAFFDPSSLERPGRLRAPGLRLPWKIAGTFHSRGSRQFWNSTGVGKTIVIDLAPAAPFERLVLSVDDPERTIDLINTARR